MFAIFWMFTQVGEERNPNASLFFFSLSLSYTRARNTDNVLL